MKKNVLLLVPSFRLGGQEQLLLRTADIFKDDYNIYIAVLTMKDCVYDIAYDVIDLNIPAQKGTINKVINVLRRVIKTRKLKKELKIDVSVSFGSTANIQNVFSKANDRIITSVMGYGSLIDSATGKLWNHIMYKKADAVICVSRNMAEDLTKLYRIDSNKVFNVNSPYDIDALFRKSREEAEGYNFTFPTIVTMGRLNKVKGYWHLIKAFSLVKKMYPSAKLVFVGDGEDREKLGRLAKDKNIADSVIFAGFHKNPLKILSKCDIYVMSSISEGFPNAMVEAMACGLPIISVDCKTGPREILTKENLHKVADDIEYGNYGILTPPVIASENYQADVIEQCDHLLGEAINKLISDRVLFDRYKKISPQRAADFSCETYYKKMKSIIEG